MTRPSAIAIARSRQQRKRYGVGGLQNQRWVSGEPSVAPASGVGTKALTTNPSPTATATPGGVMLGSQVIGGSTGDHDDVAAENTAGWPHAQPNASAEIAAVAPEQPHP